MDFARVFAMSMSNPSSPPPDALDSKGGKVAAVPYVSVPDETTRFGAATSAPAAAPDSELPQADTPPIRTTAAQTAAVRVFPGLTCTP
ncbi:hypothetical protein NKH77_49775 [Streptomyces sp. M19]